MKKLLKVSSWLAIVIGIVLIISGVWASYFIYRSIGQENIITPGDASIPGVPVRGPFTLKAQSDVIRKHVLEDTGGKTFAEMPRQVPKLDAYGNQVHDDSGKEVMTANTARDIWITATTLTTALNLGIMSYAFSALIIFIGLVTIWFGTLFRVLVRKH